METEKSARSKPGGRDGYAAFIEVPTRWSDNDFYGHMNNVVHYALFDTAVNSWLIENRVLDLHGGTTAFLVAETGCRYFSEIAFPQKVSAGLRIAHLGSSSVRYAIGLFADDAPLAAAEGHFVHVQIDRESRRPVPIEGEGRSRLEGLVR